MSRFSKWRSLATKILRSCLLPDTWKRLPESKVLLIGHEHHYNFLAFDKLYSPILGSLFYRYKKDGLSVSIILKPFSALHPSDAWELHYNYNRSYCLALPFVFLGKFCGFFNDLVERRRVEFWRKVFIKTSAEKVLAIQPDRYMCRAARDLEILIADVQHGVISDMHLWYGEKYNIDIDAKDLPCQYWVWDDESRKTIERWAVRKGIKVIKTGHFWIDRFKSPSSDDQVVRDAIDQIPERDETKPSILITLQWDLNRYASGPEFNGFMHQQLEDYIFETSDKYNWFIRLHPVHLYSERKSASLDYLKRFKDETAVEWRASTFCALPALLSVIDLHITFSSSVVLEAEWFGVKSAILDVGMATGGCRDEFYRTQRDNGMARVIDPLKSDIDSWIAHNLG